MTHRWPDLSVLALVVGVDDFGSLSAAAREAGIAQPNASRAISALERDLGVTLLRRHPRGSLLTRAGLRVASGARSLLQAADAFGDRIDEVVSGERVRLDLGASLTVAEQLVPRWLGRLREALPDADVHLQVHNSADVFDLVRSGDCLLGFVETPEKPVELHTRVVTTDELVVVAAPTHPWARRADPVTAEELARTPLILREPGSGTRATVERALAEHSPVAPALEAGSNAAGLATAAAGSEPAVLSRLAVARWIERGELVAVPVTGVDLHREIRAVWRDDLVSPVARRLVAIACDDQH
ncbi:LysR family transcriptional regulator [Pseudoclavibacter sp. CFCC 13611]|uniref:LysR family transcriptional regulator n=1 Tax=Pseudoclavibacter sp. CFCC 13611 TaxID=2615178 RepID=UPI0013018B48|nr:LysR family transcriptional regulator [Pseudoclavibacter sp. CFCC 13611]KAB1663746.1 LysR family transcriptional regulator [Pseudoclavibacter sp. CFCC 13611]KAB1664505.1 LysR family transcriptional regulator [Pseudoclavibacter sp. CFCC 13611]